MAQVTMLRYFVSSASRLFVKPAASYSTHSQTVDSFQLKQMKEMCIVVDKSDNALRPETKMNCHLITNERRGILHRAFSLFLFNSKGELLLQQRSDSKLTFPGYYTNTCCSHPLYFPDEMNEKDGILKAAQRRAGVELGIQAEDLPISDLKYLTRIHYEAASCEKWIEREIDYIIFAQKDIEVSPNPEEVKNVVYVSKENMKAFVKELADKNVPLTPWFSIILDKFLFKWWNSLDNLEKFKDHKSIHRE